MKLIDFNICVKKHKNNYLALGNKKKTENCHNGVVIDSLSLLVVEIRIVFAVNAESNAVR